MVCEMVLFCQSVVFDVWRRKLLSIRGYIHTINRNSQGSMSQYINHILRVHIKHFISCSNSCFVLISSRKNQSRGRNMSH
jgi:hypothetical protein